MKTKSIISILLLALGISFTTSSCEDMLTADSERNLYIPAQDTLYSYWGILADVQKVAERYTVLGEVRGDLVSPTSFVSDTIGAIANFDNPADGDNRLLAVKDYYKIINDCNSYLHWADTTFIIMGNVQKMKKEYAQVMAIRAWTYLQLVNNYEKVPFYTKPITSLDFFDNFNFNDAENYVDRHNLADLLASDLVKLADVDYPIYGSYSNGSVSIHSALSFFPIRLILADMYLIGENYMQAATYYYEYIKEEEAILPASYESKVFMVREDDKYISYDSRNNYMRMFRQYDKPAKTNEVITSIPGAASTMHGHVMTDIVSILCGMDVESSVSSNNAGTSEEGDNQNSAYISMTVQMRPQFAVSGYYDALVSRMKYNDFKTSTNEPDYLRGDARGCGTVNFRIDDVERNMPYKAVYNGFSYTFPVIYRKAGVWLRFAEAINRLGFPQYAFAILKDGLCKENIADLVRLPDPEPVEPEEGEEGEEGEPETFWPWEYNNQRANCYYIGFDERYRASQQPFLDFSSESFSNGSTANNSIIGVHKRGGGWMKMKENPYWDYSNLLDSIMLSKGIDTAFVKADQLKAQEERVFTLSDTIALVEELIVDELALEMAFEGNRFTDLVRFANHRNAAPALTNSEIYKQLGEDEEGSFANSDEQKFINQSGTAWLADKIARRGCPKWSEYTGFGKLIPDNYEETSEYKTMYQKLLNTQLWYFRLPETYK